MTKKQHETDWLVYQRKVQARAEADLEAEVMTDAELFAERTRLNRLIVPLNAEYKRRKDARIPSQTEAR